MGAYDRFGNYHRDPAWGQQEAEDWTEADAEDIDFPEAPERDPEYESYLDDHDCRHDDYYSEQNGDSGDESEPPF